MLDYALQDKTIHYRTERIRFAVRPCTQGHATTRFCRRFGSSFTHGPQIADSMSTGYHEWKARMVRGAERKTIYGPESKLADQIPMMEKDGWTLDTHELAYGRGKMTTNPGPI